MVVTSGYSPELVPEGPPERVPLPEGMEPEAPVLWVDDPPVVDEPLPVSEPVAVPLEPLDGVSDPWAVPYDVTEVPFPVCGTEPVAVPLEPLEGVSDFWAVPDD